jgi:hypothetical protein
MVAARARAYTDQKRTGKRKKKEKLQENKKEKKKKKNNYLAAGLASSCSRLRQ